MSKQEIQIDTKVTGLDSVEKLTNEIEDLGKTSAKAAKQVDDLNDDIKKATKTSKKAGPEIDELAEKFSKMGGAGGTAGGALESLGVIMSGPLGAAIGATVLATGGLIVALKGIKLAFDTTVESVAAYIETNDDLKKKTNETEVAFKNLKIAFGEAVIGGQDFEKVLKHLTKEFENLTKRVNSSSGEILKRFKRIAQGVALILKMVVSAISTSLMMMILPIDAALTYFLNFKRTVLSVLESIFKAAGPLAVQLGVMTQQQLDKALGNIGAELKKQEPFIFEFTQAIHAAASETIGFIARLEEVISTLKKTPAAVKPLTPPVEIVDFIDDTKRPKPPKPKKTPALPPAPTPATTTPSAPGAGPGAGPAGTVAALNMELLQTQTIAASTASVLDSVVVGSVTRVGEAMIEMGAHTANAMGEFLVGVGTMSEFGDAITDMIGNLATTVGSFFIQKGIGLAFINPAAGAGLIAAGFGLQVLGGALGAKGSGNRGGGRSGGGGGSGVSGAVTRETQRSLRAPDAGGQVTNIEIVIAGRAIEPEMVTIIDDIARLGRSRGLARLGA